MGWNNSTKMMTLPISAGDIAQAVSYASGDIGTLIRNGIINKWAKYKPIARPGIDFSSQLVNDPTYGRKWKTGTGGASWWRGTDDKCGIYFDVASSLGNISTSGTFFYNLCRGNLPWNYVRPNGGINAQPFRVFDFITYYSAASAPVSGINATDIWLQLPYYSGQIGFDTNSPTEFELSFADFNMAFASETSGTIPGVASCYMGIVLFKANFSDMYYGTSSSTLGSGDALNVDMQGEALVGEWKCAPFISSVQYPFDTASRQTAQAGRYASLFGLGVFDVTLHAPGTYIAIAVLGSWNADHTTVTYTVTIRNNSSTSVTLQNVGVEMRHIPASQDPPVPAGGEQVAGFPTNMGSITVAGDSEVPPMQFTASVIYDSTQIYYMHGFAKGYNNDPYYQIEEEAPGEEMI